MYRVQPGRGVITLPHRGWAVVSTGPAGLPFSRTSPSTGPPGSRRVLTCEGYRTPCSAARRAVFLWPGAIIIALLASRTLMSCAPPPASWGRGALFLHGKRLRVILFYSPLQNGRFCRKFSLKAFCGMISLHDQRSIMREQDDGDQFQRGPFPTGYHPDGRALVCGV